MNLKTVSLPNAIIKGKIVFIASQADYLLEDIDKSQSEKTYIMKLRSGLKIILEN